VLLVWRSQSNVSNLFLRQNHPALLIALKFRSPSPTVRPHLVRQSSVTSNLCRYRVMNSVEVRNLQSSTQQMIEAVVKQALNRLTKETLKQIFEGLVAQPVSLKARCVHDEFE